MTEFLELNPPKVFWEKIKEHVSINPGKEKIHFTDGLDRILAEDIKSGVNLPPFSRSTVDGFAVRAADTSGASESLPVYFDVVGKVFMGKQADIEVGPGEAVEIATGGMLPPGADAVLMVEYTEYLDDRTIETSKSVAVGENVVIKGEDIEKGKLLLKRGHRIRPQDIGALAGLGITDIDVYKIPEIAVISTGDELVSPEAEPESGQIRDINSYSIGSLLKKTGSKVRLEGIIRDNFDSLKKAVYNNLDADMILISGGSSVGVKDITIDVLNSLGEPGVLLHGISIKPGKPTILAVIDNCPVIGLPGHPSSAWTITNQLVIPLVNVLQGENNNLYNKNYKIQAKLNRNLISDKGREEYVPVRLILSGGDGEYIAEPITGKSSLITTLVEADGFIRIGTYTEGLNKGDRVEIELFAMKVVKYEKKDLSK